MTEVDDKKETQESKEEVICPICSNFEPQAWRKNMCRNCFHPLDEHGSKDENNDISSAKDKKLENDKVNDMQKKKSETDTSKKKGEPPKTFPKSKNPNLSVDISKKDTSGTSSCNSPISPLKKIGSTFIKSPESKDFKSKSLLSPTKTPDDSKSKGRESLFPQKNVSHSKFETKKAESSKDNEKHVASAPSALTKWKENENKSLSKDKGPSGEENKQIGKQAQSKADDNKNKLDEKASKFQSKTPGPKDKKEQDAKTPGSSSLTNRDNTPKSKTDDASKVRQFAKTFGSDLEESRCNTLERQKKEKSATTAPANDQCKSAIKNQSTPEATQKDTNSTSGKEKESSALYEKISRFTHTGLKKTDKNDKSYGSLDRKRQKSEEKTPETSAEAGKRIDAELETVKKQLSCMEIKCKSLESENDKLRSGLKEKETVEHSLKTQKAEVENAIKSLRDTLQSMADRCGKLENDNDTLLDKLKAQQIQQQEALTTANKEEIESMEAQLSESENDIENIKSENEDLRQEILDLKVEMEEMYDSFRDQEAEEFRDLQRELEMTAKNCRVLQFKLRKAERRSEQVEIDRQSCEEKLHLLQNQFEDADARAHIRSIEDELRMAKEVSVRLHDELDILDDKRQKCEEENSHLTRLLEQSDKKQFRLEMEVDKLRDQMADLRRQLAERSQNAGTPSAEEANDRKVLLGRIGKQGSQDQDVSQLMRDLYDSMERETDLKDQLKFAEEETKSMRKKLEELEEENDTLIQQLKKMSTAQVTRREEPTQGGAVTETEVELKVQLDLNEQDLLLSKKKIQDFGNENEKLKEEIANLKKLIQEKDQQLYVIPEPSSPNAYYEDKMKEMRLEADDLRWRIIEKEREISCLYVQLSNYQTRQSSKPRKTNSFDSEYSQVVDLKKHLEYVMQENSELKQKMHDLEDQQGHSLRKSKSPIRIESQVFESSRQSPAKNNVEMIGKTSLSDANVMFTNSKDDENHSLSHTDQTDTAHIISNTDVLRDPITSTLADNEMANQHDSETCDQKLKALELENQNLQLKLSELTKEIELLQQNLSNDAQERKDAKGEGQESREELMDTILDLEEEVESLTEKLKQRNEETASLIKKEKEYLTQIEKIEDDYRKKELDLLNDLDISQDKNEILSNLLDIVKERADAAERELERVAASFSVASDGSGRSARVISTCSDVSVGSDEVFDGASPGVSPGLSPVLPGSPESPLKRQVIQKDWDNQFRKRIDCLERLLAEERQKLAATEKKLALVSTENISTAMSDDAKLFAREKELLQAEILEGKKLLKIATDQIKGLRERMFTLEEENRCLRITYANELAESEESENEKTPSYHIDERPPSFDVAMKDASKTQTTTDVSNYRERIASLEKQLKEVEAQWRAKCTTIEKEKNESQQRLRDLTIDSEALRGSLKGFKEDVCIKQKQLREIEEKITVNSDILKRKEEIINEQEEIIKQREEDLQSLLDQISQRDNDIRDLREKVHPINEKLKDKEEIINSLKDIIDSKQDEINYQSEEISELNETIELKQNEIDELKGNTKTQNVTKAEWEQDNKQLKNDLESMASNLGKLHTDNCTLQEELEKTKQALSEAMVLWNKDRSQIEIAYNVAKEKLRMYEETAAKKESQIVGLLRKETHKLLESKEKISTEFRVTKIEHEANMRTLKCEKLKLQDELTQKIRQLTAEMISNDKMKEELDRLRAQEDVAYQIQYHEKVLRAEYLAMKVRYETRLENLQKEHMKLLGVLDKLQREKVLNQEMIKGVQKGMGTMKETYTKDLEHWKEERNVLEKHIKEIESSRKLAAELERKVEELKQQLADQEYERAEIINRMTTERSKWELERSGMQSHMNQLEEKLDTVAYSQYRTKDMQSRMEVAWESERAEQKRLLNEAHELAMDLQRQLKCRDDEHSRERRALLEQLKKLRKELDEEQMLREKRLKQIETSKRETEDLKTKLKEMCQRSEKDHEVSMKERVDLVRRLADFRRSHKRDQRRIEDVLSELTRLRELASIVIDSEDPDVDTDIVSRLEQLSKPESKRLSIHASTDIQQKINEVVLQYMKESLKEIHFAADNLSRPSSRGSSEDERRRLRRSISSSELDFLLKDEAVVEQQIEHLKDSRRNTPTKHLDMVSNKLSRNIYHTGPRDIADIRSEDSDTEMMLDPEPGTVNDRHNRIMIDVHHEEGVTSRFPVPPPSLLLPSQRVISVQSQSSKTISTSLTSTVSSRQSPNSISLDVLNNGSERQAFSASASPTHGQNCFEFSNPKCKSDCNIPANSSKVSKEAARRMFFESLEDSNQHPSNVKSISENNIAIKNETTLISNDLAKDAVGESTEISRKHGCSSSDSETKLHGKDDSHLKAGQPKKKRRLFKKSSSMDTSAVSNTLADAGVSAISPGAPSSLSPFELFAAVKRRLKPSLKRSSSLSEGRKGGTISEDDGSKYSGHVDAYASSSYSSRNQSLGESPISTPMVDEPLTPESGRLIPPPTPPISMMNRKMLPKLQEVHEDDHKRKSRAKKNDTKSKFRSKSEERAKSGPASLTQNVVFQEDIASPSSHSAFSETSV